jgi:hypothetical protein
MLLISIQINNINEYPELTKVNEAELYAKAQCTDLNLWHVLIEEEF